MRPAGFDYTTQMLADEGRARCQFPGCGRVVRVSLTWPVLVWLDMAMDSQAAKTRARIEVCSQYLGKMCQAGVVPDIKPDGLGRVLEFPHR